MTELALAHKALSMLSLPGKQQPLRVLERELAAAHASFTGSGLLL
jgi:hypothetical protein